MDERFAQLPASLRAQSLTTSLGGVPALIAHPDPGWQGDSDAAGKDGPRTPDERPGAPRPIMIWMHGRTVNKELDPGRYLRWIRAGIAAVALDLPGHGERSREGMQGSDRTLEIVEQMAGEIDGVLEALREPRWRGAFDFDRVGIGGMSAGGMAALIRLCRNHSFACAAVESTAGDFEAMSGSTSFFTSGGRDPGGARARALSPMGHLGAWCPTPLLALHSEADQWVPVGAIRSFCEALAARYGELGADPGLVRLRTWETTGAPNEHAGFGRVASQAKDAQVEFLKEQLGA